jgi:hypothetical protein
MRALLGSAMLLAVAGCGDNGGGGPGGGPDGGPGGGPDGPDPDTCVGFECKPVACAAQQRPLTSISGTVLAPNGTLPLHGVTVYVPGEPPGALAEGAQCGRCTENPSSSVARTLSEADGRFRLYNVPAGKDIPLVIKIGKWRRQITIPRVEACVETGLGAEVTRLPRDQTEGDLPKIAVTTGGEDGLECLVRKLGISDAEVTTSAGAGRVHLYAGTGGLQSFSGGGAFPSATTLWSSLDKLRQYDQVLLSCEGAQNPGTKPQAALDAMKAYADLGGRVYASHWHNIWLGAGSGGGPTQPAWKSIAQWSATDGDPGAALVIDEVMNPLGSPFATWMVNVGGSPSRGQLPLTPGTGHATARSVDPSRAERWLYAPGTGTRPQLFHFTTPVAQPSPEARCGKVVFTDLHVSAVPGTGGYPAACSGSPLTPQERALAFTLFELAGHIRSYVLDPPPCDPVPGS